jgi:AbrB family looped-hinge helix DNA binding protein
MKSTGVVRRIDDLGRVVIPKEIRRNMLLEEGDPLEIFTDAENGTVTFKKYVPDYDFYDMVTDLERRFVFATEMVGHKNTNEIKQRFEDIKKLWLDTAIEE